MSEFGAAASSVGEGTRLGGNELLIEDGRVRRLTAAIVAVMLTAFFTVILLTVLGGTLDGFVGVVPLAWILGPALWVLSIVLCEVYIRNTRTSAAVGGDRAEGVEAANV